MSKWSFVALGEICELTGGNSAPQGSEPFENGTLPFVRMRDLGRYHFTSNLNKTDDKLTESAVQKYRMKIFEPGCILFPRSGSVFLNHRAILGIRASIVSHIGVLHKFSDSINVRFLYYYLQTYDMTRLSKKTTGVDSIAFSDVVKIQIPLPPLPEQERIVRLLDEAESLRATRERANLRMEQFVPALFQEMFGDVEINDKKWKTKPLNELLSKIESGWSPVCLDRPVEQDEWGVLKLGALTYCEYDDTQNKAFPIELKPRPELEVKARDVLFSRKNTYDLVAACVFVFETRPRLMLSDLTFRLCIRDENELLPEYLWRVMIQPNKRKKIQTLATGSAANMPNISKTRLLTIDIPVPPLALQREFAARMEEARGLQSAQARSAGRVEALYQSMLARAFAGEL
jgi:type I restriction enzyme S subunit